LFRARANAAQAQTVPQGERLAVRGALAHEAGMTAIGILGVRGRMGQAIGNAAAEAGATIAGGIDRDGFVHGDHGSAEALAAASDVLVDFTAPDALQAHLDAAVAAATPIVIGTTGLSEDHHRAIEAAARKVAVLQTANTSLGINLLRGLVEEAARRLGPDWDIEILDMHHRHKLDSPSGTSLLLGASANTGRGAASNVEMNRFDRMREGPHEREEGGIYYASLRGGSVAGDHLVVFAGDGERIELGHRAENRGIFAKGAVRAALWLAGKPAGRYTMKDVLGL
jgi:4-hydroxy-tetrahydrodipicolinate reductase